MKLIVGLGNPGEKYEKTKHNSGFNVLDRFLRDFKTSGKIIWENNNKFKSYITEIEWQRRFIRSDQTNLERVILIKPKTYMNNSGLAVLLVSSFYKIDPSDIWVVHDEIDLPLGAIKIRFGGGTAGHKGVTSVMEKIGTDKFWRFRLGVGHPRFSTKDKSLKVKYNGVDKFVLKEFDRGEFGKARELVKRASQAIEEALEKGLESAMNRFNTK